MPRVFVSASIFMIVLGLAEPPARAQSSSDATPKSLRVAQNVSPTQQEEQRAASKLSKAERVALKQANVACKAEAKGKKIRWPKSRTYMRDCLKEALKEHPTIKVDELKIDRNMRVLEVKDPI
jgi:hypothetical protein